MGVEKAWTTHRGEIEDADGPVQELKAAQPILKEVGKAELSGDLGEHEKEAWIEQCSEVVSVTKSAVRSSYQNLLREVESEFRDEIGDDFLPRLDDHISDQLTEVVIHQTTDRHSDTSYQWRFDDGTVFSTTGGKHWDWNQYEDLLFDETGFETRPPERRDGRQWKEWLRSVLNKNATRKETVGPRTQALDDLSGYIRRTEAYPTPEQAAYYNGLWMPEEGSSWAGVPSKRVSDYADDNSITVRALQEELDAREYIYKKVKQVRLPDGKYIRFWRLSTEFAEPLSFQNEEDNPYENNDTNTETQ